MKKSERKKVKLRIVLMIETILSANKGNLKLNWIDAHNDNNFPAIRAAYREAAKENIRAIRSSLLALRAVEKQMPMPVKMQIAFSNRARYFYKNGQRDLVVSYQAYCQSCNKLVDFGNKPSEAYEFARKYKKYCPRCGQKLWWPSC